MSREAKPGELRGIQILEKLEKMFKRPETRLDAQKILSQVSVDAQTYAKHLVMSGPSSDAAAAKECGMTKAQLDAAASELAAKLLPQKKV
jgi:hypothetical protein